MKFHNIVSKLKVYWSYLEGRKTYIVGAVGTLLNLFVVVYPNALTPPEVLKLNGVLIALGGMAIRSSISKLE